MAGFTVPGSRKNVVYKGSCMWTFTVNGVLPQTYDKGKIYSVLGICLFRISPIAWIARDVIASILANKLPVIE